MARHNSTGKPSATDIPISDYALTLLDLGAELNQGCPGPEDITVR
jgi:hypothetical protein